jgi:hypothetical protein
MTKVLVFVRVSGVKYTTTPSLPGFIPSPHNIKKRELDSTASVREGRLELPLKCLSAVPSGHPSATAVESRVLKVAGLQTGY